MKKTSTTYKNCGSFLLRIRQILSTLLILILPLFLMGEGTRNLAPNSDDIVMLMTNRPDFGDFASYFGPEDSRLYFSIKDASEVVYLGFTREYNFDGTPQSTGSYQLRIRRASDGETVHGPFIISSANENVTSWADAANGPFALTGQGYQTTDPAFFFEPDQADDYFIEFNAVIYIGFWDVTVASGGVAQQGRVWSKNWGFRTPSEANLSPECLWDREFNGTLFSYTDDGFVTKIDFADSGFQGLSFNVAFNETGPGNTGSIEEDRKSVPNQNLTNNIAQHKIFLNEPDIDLFPDGQCGEITSTGAFSCTETGYCLPVSVSQPGLVTIILDFDQNGVFDPDSEDISIPYNFEEGELTACVPWDGIQGDGSPVGPGDVVNILYQFAQGIQHWSVYDGEFLKNGFCVEPVRPNCGDGVSTNTLYWDDRNIPDDPGTGQPKDGRAGCECQNEGCRTWNNFDPNTEDCNQIDDDITLGYGDKNTLNTWWFANITVSEQVNVPIVFACMIDGPTEICRETTGELTVSTTSPSDFITSLEWYHPDGSVISSGDGSNTSIIVEDPGIYTVFVQDIFGCETSCTHDLDIITCPVDLELDKSVDEPSPYGGQVVTFTIMVTNQGPGFATGVQIEDTVPNGFSNITNISDGGTFNGSTVTWSNLFIDVGETLTFSFQATVEVTGSHTNLAEVTIINEEDVDSTPDNGVDTDGDGDVEDDPDDEDDGDGVVVTPLPCEISAEISNILCSDNDTPIDPDDDTYTFEVMVTGLSTGGGWHATDPGNTSGGYMETVTFGPYPISGGGVDFLIIDDVDNMCTASIMVAAPPTCSDKCLIESELSNVQCLDAGTPSHPEDDQFTFDLTVTGFNIGASWTASDGTTGSYDETVGFGPFPIANGPQTIIITDIDDSNCTHEITVQPPATCSDLCDIEAQVLNIQCLDGGTPSMPEDDQYTFDVIVTGLNTGASWTADNGTTGPYGTEVSFGPFPISGGPVSFTIMDDVDGACTASIEVTPPPTCSDLCVLETSLSEMECLDSGTPSHPEDDQYTFMLTVTGLNTGSGWSSSVGVAGAYGVPTFFGPFPISGGPINIVITDNEDEECEIVVNIAPPEPCSDLCVIEAQVSDPECQNAGTPSMGDDDTFTFSVVVTGLNTGTGWTASDGTSGTYGVPIDFGPYDIAAGPVEIVITDAADGNCTTTFEVIPPETCSDLCVIQPSIANITCLDAGTPSLPGDDEFTFDLTITGFNTGASWTSNVGVDGSYDQPVNVGPFLISEGPVNITVTDIDDPSCQVIFSVNPPQPCSDLCVLDAELFDLECQNAGTPSQPEDDIFTFDLLVTGLNTGANWTSSVSTSGNYDELTSFGPFDIADGPFDLVITDQADPNCQIIIPITPPETCSDLCVIQASVENTLCLEAGTPSHPEDDEFTFELTVTGFNTGNVWVSSDGVVGNYDEMIVMGPYPIDGGPLMITIEDINDPECNTTFIVAPPETCSDLCVLEADLTDLTCLDSGTPSHPEDDQFTFNLTVTGLNTGDTWIASDGTMGNYDEVTGFGPFDIADGPFNLIIMDAGNGDCQVTVEVIPPETCSDLCVITHAINRLECRDNNTPLDPTDDIWTFELKINGLNTAGSGWNSTIDVDGLYDVSVLMGPYDISDGPLSFTVFDNDDPNCFTEVFVDQPEPCSDACLIMAEEEVVICDDNGTPEDGSDDYFEFNVVLTSINTLGGWTASDGSMGAYNEMYTFGPYLVSDGDVVINIMDDTRDCSLELVASPPEISIICPDDIDSQTITREVQLIEGEIAETDSVFSELDTLCWINGYQLDLPNVHYDMQQLTVSPDQDSAELFTFILFTDMEPSPTTPVPGQAEGFGAVFLGDFMWDDPCCNILNGPDDPFIPGVDTIDNPIVTAPELDGFTAVQKIVMYLEPGEVYTLLTSTWGSNVYGEYRWVVFNHNFEQVLEEEPPMDPFPVITADLTYQLTFADLDSILNNPSSIDITGEGMPSDYCGFDFIEFFDEMNGGDCENITITRTWVLHDVQGNTDSCEQIITLYRPSIDEVALPPLTVIFDCGEEFPVDEEGHPHPDITGYPVLVTPYGEVELNPNYFNISAGYKDIIVILDGENFEEIIREWTIVDECLDTIAQFNQRIKFMDIFGPLVECPLSEHYCPILEQNIMLFPTDPFECTATIEAPWPVVSDPCSSTWETVTEVWADTQPNATLITTLQPDDPRTLPPLGLGDYWFRYIVTDDHGNVTVQDCRFRVGDLDEPTAICENELEVVLDANGQAVVTVDQVNEGSYDNCGVEEILVRRLVNNDPETCEPIDPEYTDWAASITFNCCDADQFITIELLVTDVNGNTNTCWLQVHIEDLIVPECSGLEDIVVSCEDLPVDFDPNSIDDLAATFGMPAVDDNCQVIITELDPLMELTDCGSGTIRRRVVASDNFGNKDTCVQEIVITSSEKFEIRFPADQTTDCVDNVDLLEIFSPGCDDFAMTYADEYLPAQGEECILVERTYNLVNWCNYDGESDPMTISREEDCDGNAGDEDVWVLMRSGTVYVDRDDNENNSVPAAGEKGTSCDGSSNPSGYWRTIANIGYWQYIQRIRIENTAPPVVSFEQLEPVCYNGTPGCTQLVSYPIQVGTNCTVNTVTDIIVFSDLENDGILEEIILDPGTVTGSFPNYMINVEFPIGSHSVEIRITDACENTTTEVLPFEIIDCYMEEPNCREDQIIYQLEAIDPPFDVNGDGEIDYASVEVLALDLLESIPFDCSEPVTVSVNFAGEMPASTQESVLLTCDNRYEAELEVYVWDNAFNPYTIQPDGTMGGPNYTFCTLTVNLQDPTRACLEGYPDFPGQAQLEFGSDGGVDLLDDQIKVYNNQKPKGKLLQNVPNPFQESTKIGFELTESGPVVLTIRDINGKLLNEFKDNFTIGYNEFVIFKENLPPGTLLYTLSSDQFTSTRKMILIE